LIGPDGSGKTTVSRRLVERDDLPFERRELVRESLYVLPRLDRLVTWWDRHQPPQPPPPEPEGRHSAMVRPLSAWKSMAIATYHAADMFLGRPRLRRPHPESCLLVFDRSFYDFSFLRGHGNLQGWYLRLLSPLVPAPDLLLYLERDPDAIYRDKPELSLDEIRRQQRAVERLVRSCPFGETLHADGGVEATVARAAEAIRRAAGRSLLNL
jgi:hypothetical protein